jgi:N-acetylglutamate synthase-like GNAT family acetyltransferase
LDFAYNETFTTRTDTEWGTLFCNEGQPDYYDANHAHIREFHKEPQAVIDEVVHFYQAKGLIPRFYLYNLEVQQELITQLKANHFGFEELVSPIQLWDNTVIEKVQNEDVTIELVTENNYTEALEIECSIKEFGGRVVREKAFDHEFHHPNFTHFLLRYKGVACATACIFDNGKQARMESVATLEEYRGKGLIGELIRHIQMVTVEKGYENLWVFPINEKIEKVYQKYGFNTIETLKTGHAYLGGKSILEIRE